MASLVQFPLHPRYMPGIFFPQEEQEERVFLKKWLRLAREPERYDPDEVPKRAFLEAAPKTIPDFVKISARMAMCPEAKALVEELEPGVHQFLPVEIVRKRGKKPIHRLDGRVLDTPYYALNAQTFLDAVCLERSEVQISPVAGRAPNVWRLPGKPLVLRREVVQGHHVWRGRYQLGRDLFFSDALTEAIQAKKLRKLEFARLEEA